MRGFGVSGLVAALALTDCTSTPPLPPEVTPVEASAYLDKRDVVLIDVRKPEEWAESGVAQGAERVTLQDPDFMTSVEAILDYDKDADVVFICRSGGRSATARDQLIGAGYRSVSSVAGGTLGDEGWIASGLPVEQVNR
ncbi:MAG: rhodanese-like domain-containing protein [Hyphomonadaceae bacterium]|nr:rhodanese-like domain-containing protein [Hyphomonadaceae bacterium]